jgi:hypothetical protein
MRLVLAGRRQGNCEEDVAENNCNGIVMNHLAGIASMIVYTHEDGSQCSRPGPITLPLGALIESEFEVVYGLCEHVVISVNTFDDLESEPEPVAKPTLTSAPKSAVDGAIAAPQPHVADKPVSADVIERAKVPPKIKSNFSTAPPAVRAAVAAATAATKTANLDRYEFPISPEDAAELSRIHNGTDIEVGGGAAVNPFSSNFDPRGGAKKDTKPVPGRW